MYPGPARFPDGLQRESHDLRLQKTQNDRKGALVHGSFIGVGSGKRQRQ